MKKKNPPCEIYYFSDMQKCVKCGLEWDANDPCPPTCKLRIPENVSLIKKIFGFFGWGK